MELSADRGRVRFLGEAVFLFCFAAMLSTPLIWHFLDPSAAQSDNRALAKPPGFPSGLAELWQWPRRAEAYLDDHFGLRPQLVRANVNIHWHLLDSSSVSSIVVGRNGRIFFSDGEVPFRAALGNCGAWWSADYRADFVHEAEAGLTSLRRAFPNVSVLLVPTSPVLYPQDLPAWMERACAGHVPLATDILQHLPDPLREMVSYPRDVAVSLPASGPLIPKKNFHWDGRGPDLLMQSFVDGRFHMPRVIEPGWTERVVPSDLAPLLPGIELVDRISVPGWGTSGVRFCDVSVCAQRAPLDGIALPLETLWAERPGAGGKLLLLSDSFGAKAAATLIEYFSDIVMINMNNVQRLSPDQRRSLWYRLNNDWRPDYVLVVVQDGNISLLSRFAKVLPGAEP